MAQTKLPGHLASLLRHRVSPDVADAKPSQENDVPAGKIARRRSAREKRKAKAAAERAAAKDSLKEERKKARLAAKKSTQAAAGSLSDFPNVTASAGASKDKNLSTTKCQPKALKKKKIKNKSRTTDDKACPASVVDPEGAAFDAEMIRRLEAKLGIVGDKAKRRRCEDRIFEDLGFDDIGAEGEEAPSSGSDGEPVEEPSGSQLRAQPERENNTGGTKRKKRDDTFSSFISGIVTDAA